MEVRAAQPDAAEVEVAPGLLDVRGFAVSLGLLAVFAGVLPPLANLLIVEYFPDRPAPADLLFEVLPYVGWARYLTALTLVVSATLFAFHSIRRFPERLPEIASVFALMYLFRSVIMVLTPLADAYGPGTFVFPFEQHGMFPSGHVGAMVLFVLLTDRREAPRLQRILVWLAVIGAVAIVVAHGHYSIDVVGGWLLSYFVQKEWAGGSLFEPVKRLVRCAGAG